MSKVEIRNTSILVHNYTRGDMPNFETFFQTYDSVRHCYSDVALYIDPLTDTLYLPGGTPRWILEKYFTPADITYLNRTDPFVKVNKIKLSSIPRDDTQKEALRFCLTQGEYQKYKNKHQFFLNLNTGKGKTYCTIFTTAFLGIRSAIIMSSLDWIEQWKERILEYTNTKEDEIYIIAKSVSITKIQRNMVDIKKIKYFLISHDTIRAYGDKYGWDEVTDLFINLKIGVKIYDEAHLYTTNIFKIDFYTNTWRTYYLTATPMLSDVFKNKVFQRAYGTVPKIDLYNQEEDAHTDYIAILYNSHPSVVDLQNSKTNYGFNIMWYSNYIVSRPAYYQILWILLDEVLEKKLSKDGKVLIYIGTNQAIQITYNWIRYMYPDYSVGIFTTLTEKKHKREQLDCKIILSTGKSAGAALDIKNLEITIDLADPAKSPVIIRQKLGRTRDWNTLFIDIIDIGFPALRFYYKQRLSVFKKYARKINPPKYLEDKDIRERILSIQAKSKLLLKQAQERKNLKEVITIQKQVMKFTNSEYNYFQDYME